MNGYQPPNGIPGMQGNVQMPPGINIVPNQQGFIGFQQPQMMQQLPVDPVLLSNLLAMQFAGQQQMLMPGGSVPDYAQMGQMAAPAPVATDMGQMIQSGQQMLVPTAMPPMAPPPPPIEQIPQHAPHIGQIPAPPADMGQMAHPTINPLPPINAPQNMQNNSPYIAGHEAYNPNNNNMHGGNNQMVNPGQEYNQFNQNSNAFQQNNNTFNQNNQRNNNMHGNNIYGVNPDNNNHGSFNQNNNQHKQKNSDSKKWQQRGGNKRFHQNNQRSNNQTRMNQDPGMQHQNADTHYNAQHNPHDHPQADQGNAQGNVTYPISAANNMTNAGNNSWSHQQNTNSNNNWPQQQMHATPTTTTYSNHQATNSTVDNGNWPKPEGSANNLSSTNWTQPAKPNSGQNNNKWPNQASTMMKSTNSNWPPQSSSSGNTSTTSKWPPKSSASSNTSTASKWPPQSSTVTNITAGSKRPPQSVVGTSTTTTAKWPAQSSSTTNTDTASNWHQQSPADRKTATATTWPPQSSAGSNNTLTSTKWPPQSSTSSASTASKLSSSTPSISNWSNQHRGSQQERSSNESAGNKQTGHGINSLPFLNQNRDSTQYGGHNSAEIPPWQQPSKHPNPNTNIPGSNPHTSQTTPDRPFHSSVVADRKPYAEDSATLNPRQSRSEIIPPNASHSHDVRHVHADLLKLQAQIEKQREAHLAGLPPVSPHNPEAGVPIPDLYAKHHRRDFPGDVRRDLLQRDHPRIEKSALHPLEIANDLRRGQGPIEHLPSSDLHQLDKFDKSHFDAGPHPRFPHVPEAAPQERAPQNLDPALLDQIRMDLALADAARAHLVEEDRRLLAAAMLGRPLPGIDPRLPLDIREASELRHLAGALPPPPVHDPILERNIALNAAREQFLTGRIPPVDPLGLPLPGSHLDKALASLSAGHKQIEYEKQLFEETLARQADKQRLRKQDEDIEEQRRARSYEHPLYPQEPTIPDARKSDTKGRIADDRHYKSRSKSPSWSRSRDRLPSESPPRFRTRSRSGEFRSRSRTPLDLLPGKDRTAYMSRESMERDRSHGVATEYDYGPPLYSDQLSSVESPYEREKDRSNPDISYHRDDEIGKYHDGKDLSPLRTVGWSKRHQSTSQWVSSVRSRSRERSPRHDHTPSLSHSRGERRRCSRSTDRSRSSDRHRSSSTNKQSSSHRSTSTRDSISSRVRDSTANRTHDSTSTSRPHDSTSSRTYDSTSSRTHDSISSRTHDTTSRHTHDSTSSRASDSTLSSRARDSTSSSRTRDSTSTSRRVSHGDGSSSSKSSTRLAVGSLAPATSERMLKSLFSSIGGLKNVRMSASRKCALVTFETRSQAEDCRRKYHKALVDQSNITVEFD